MVDTLIIYAHPGRKGHNAHTLNEVEDWLNANDNEYELIDLYKEGYDPILGQTEHLVSGKPVVTKETKKYQEMVRKAKQLIFIYPVWWAGPPAILKGFFDKVFSAKFAFKYEKLPFPIFGMKARPVPLLKGKKAVVFQTSGAQPWVQKLFLRNAYVYLAKKLTLSFCGIKTRVHVVGGCGDPICRTREEIIGRNVRKGLSWLF